MVILVLTSNNGCWRSEAPRFVMCTRPLSVLSLPWATQHSSDRTPCPALPCSALANGRARSLHLQRDTLASCRDHCHCHCHCCCHTTDRAACVAYLPPFACLSIHHAYIASSSSSTVYPSSHRHPIAWPSTASSSIRKRRPSHRPSAFQRDTNPDLPVHPWRDPPETSCSS